MIPPARGLHQSDTLADVEHLADDVEVPGGAGGRREADLIDPDPQGLLALGDDVVPDVAGEHLSRTLGGRLLGLDFRCSSLLSVIGLRDRAQLSFFPGRQVVPRSQRHLLRGAHRWRGRAG